MIDISSILNVVTRTVFLLMSLFLFGYVLVPDYRPDLLGLTLGLAAGLVNVRYLAMKVQQVAQLAVSTEKKRFSFGYVTRMCIALLVVMFAVKFGDISLAATIIGLFTAQLLLLVVALVISLKNRE